jgi:hypothetical protein
MISHKFLYLQVSKVSKVGLDTLDTPHYTHIQKKTGARNG